MARSWHQLMVSNHYLGHWSRNPLHIWCVHWSGEFSYFWLKLYKFGPSGGRKWLQLLVSDNYLEYWSLKLLHSDQVSFEKLLDFFAKYQHSGGQKWQKLMVYVNWTVSWHFFAMFTVDLCLLSDDAAKSSLDLLLLIYMLTHLYKKKKRLMK